MHRKELIQTIQKDIDILYHLPSDEDDTEDAVSKILAVHLTQCLGELKKAEMIEQIIDNDWKSGVNSGTTLNRIEELIKQDYHDIFEDNIAEQCRNSQMEENKVYSQAEVRKYQITKDKIVRKCEEIIDKNLVWSIKPNDKYMACDIESRFGRGSIYATYTGIESNFKFEDSGASARELSQQIDRVKTELQESFDKCLEMLRENLFWQH